MSGTVSQEPTRSSRGTSGPVGSCGAFVHRHSLPATARQSKLHRCKSIWRRPRVVYLHTSHRCPTDHLRPRSPAGPARRGAVLKGLPRMSPVLAPPARPRRRRRRRRRSSRRASPPPTAGPSTWSAAATRCDDIACATAPRTASSSRSNHLSHGGNSLRIGQRLPVPRTAAMARATAAKAKAAHTRAARAGLPPSAARPTWSAPATPSAASRPSAGSRSPRCSRPTTCGRPR